MSTVSLRSPVASLGGRAALVYLGRSLTRAELYLAADAVAEELRVQGIGAGHRVGVLFRNTPEFIVAFFGVLRAGASAALLPVHASVAEVEELLAGVKASAILLPPEACRNDRAGATISALITISVPSEIAPICLRLGQHVGPSTSPDEITIQFTSGVSGRMKAVPRSESNLLDEIAAVTSCLGVDGADTTVCPCSLFHAYGLINGFLVPLFSDQTIGLVDWFVPNGTIELIRSLRATVFVGVPVMYKLMAEAYGAPARDLTSLRCSLSAGAPLSPDILRAFRSRYSIHIRELYGTTETGVVALNLLDDVPGVGRPLSRRTVTIVDADGRPVCPGENGEIMVKSPANAHGYINDPILTASSFRDENYLTGDFGVLHTNGVLEISGRKTTFINVAGRKVDPSEIERVLASFDAISECAVVGAKDADGGEVVKAVVVPSRQVTAQEIQLFCRSHLPSFKVPRHVVILDTLPRSATGKILRHRLSDV